MDTVLFGDLTVEMILRYAGIAVGAIVVAALLVKVLRRGEKNEHVQAVACLGCGWQGRVSRYAGRCPRCNEPLGDLKAER